MPAVPADTFILFGAFLAAAGRASVRLVFVATWLPNVGSAMFVYWLARRHGARFLRTRVGNALLRPAQLEQVARFYARWGAPAIFVSRFLPGFRAVVPVFAGFAHVPWLRILLPLAGASAIWYGLLVYIGGVAGRNWETVLAIFQEWSTALLLIAAVLLVLVAVWWWRSRFRAT